MGILCFGIYPNTFTSDYQTKYSGRFVTRRAVVKVSFPRINTQVPGKLILSLLNFPIALMKLVLRTTLGKALTIIVVLVVIGTGSYFGYRNWQSKQWKMAIDSYRRADYSKAGEYLEKAPMPTGIDDLRIYGQTMFAIGKYDKAEDAYEKVKAQQNDPNVRLLLGNIANEKKEYDKAIGIYEGLIGTNPNYIQAYLNLAVLYQMQGKKDQAVEVAERGIKANSGSTSLYNLLLNITFDDKGSESHKLAVEKLKELDPQNPLLLQADKQQP